jgi:hypothetical protein
VRARIDIEQDAFTKMMYREKPVRGPLGGGKAARRTGRNVRRRAQRAFTRAAGKDRGRISLQWRCPGGTKLYVRFTSETTG